MVGSDDGGSVALSAPQATDSMDRDDKDLSLLSAREVKNRIIAAGGMIPAGHLEKSELVDVLKDVLASRQSSQPPSIHELSKLSVSELKRKIFFAGAHVPAGHLEKSDMVKVLHDALQAQTKRIKQAPAQTQANNKDSHKKSSSSSLPASNGQKPNSKPAKPKQEKSEAELAAEKEQEEIVKLHLLDEQELRGLILEAGAELPAGTLSKHFLVTALRNARKAKKARAEAKASATEGGGEGEVVRHTGEESNAALVPQCALVCLPPQPSWPAPEKHWASLTFGSSWKTEAPHFHWRHRFSPTTLAAPNWQL